MTHHWITALVARWHRWADNVIDETVTESEIHFVGERGPEMIVPNRPNGKATAGDRDE